MCRLPQVMTAKYVHSYFDLLRSQVEHLLQFSTVGEWVSNRRQSRQEYQELPKAWEAWVLSKGLAMLLSFAKKDDWEDHDNSSHEMGIS